MAGKVIGSSGKVSSVYSMASLCLSDCVSKIDCTWKLLLSFSPCDHCGNSLEPVKVVVAYSLAQEGHLYSCLPNTGSSVELGIRKERI